GAGGESIGRQQLALEGEDNREVPAEHEDLELGAARQGVVETIEQLHRPAAGVGRHQPDPAVDVPAEDHDPALDAGDGGTQRGEVRGGVDQEGGPMSLGDAPAVPARLEDHDAVSINTRGGWAQEWRNRG